MLRSLLVRIYKEDVRRTKAVILIQKIGRGHIQKQTLRVKRKLKMALVIQMRYRHYKARKLCNTLRQELHAKRILLRAFNNYLYRKRRGKIMALSKKYGRQCRIIQRAIRRCLGRWMQRRIKESKRARKEVYIAMMHRLGRLLAGIQLKLVYESMRRRIGVHTKTTSKIDCPCYGPFHALFINALSTKPITDVDALATNKTDAKGLIKFVTRMPNFLHTKGEKGDKKEKVPIEKTPEQIAAEEAAAAEFAAKKAAYLAQSQTNAASSGSGAKAVFAPAKKKKKAPTKKIISSNLIQYLLNNQIPILPQHPKGKVTVVDIDILLNKCKDEDNRSNHISYGEFMTAVKVLSDVFFEGKKTEERKRDRVEENGRPPPMIAEAEVENNANATSKFDEVAPGAAGSDSSEGAAGSATSTNLGGLVVTEEKSCNVAGAAMIEENNNAMTSSITAINIYDKREDKLNSKKSKNEKKSNVKDVCTNAEDDPLDIEAKRIARLKYLQCLQQRVSARRDLLLEVSFSFSEVQDNYRFAFLLNALIQYKKEEWISDVNAWLETESTAILGVFVRTIQCMVRQRFARKVLAIRSEEARARKAWLKLSSVALPLQCLIRRFLAKHRLMRHARQFILKYLPYEGKPYWYHPTTKITSYTKPLILQILGNKYDCESIALPARQLEYVVKCNCCSIAPSAVNCTECEESFCKNCYESMHSKGKRRRHNYTKIPMCVYCKGQMATKNCMTCQTCNPRSDSAQRYVSPPERGVLCDTCFVHVHDAYERSLQQHQQTKKAARHQLLHSKDAYLVRHQMHIPLLTNHRFDYLIQPCEECTWRSASYRCNDCGQVYCSTCLIGLHSIGGPFSKHIAEPLPYYTPEMHTSYLSDATKKAIAIKMEILSRGAAKIAQQRRLAAAIKLQSYWRRIYMGRLGRAYMKRQRFKLRKAYRLRKRENEEWRGTKLYKALSWLGMAPPLLSDTREEQALRRVSVLSRQRAKDYIWKNQSDWAFYAERHMKRKKARESKNRDDYDDDDDDDDDVEEETFQNSVDVESIIADGKLDGKERWRLQHWRKGIPKKSFDVGTIEELQDQAARGGFRLPGRIMVRLGKQSAVTTCDLTGLLKPGSLVRIGVNLFGILEIDTVGVKLTRKWRHETSINGEIIYRLPVYANEKDRLHFQFHYHLYDFTLGNPLVQTGIRMYKGINTNLKEFCLKRMRNNIKKGRGSNAKAWRESAKKFHRREKMAEIFLDRDEDGNITKLIDLSQEENPEEAAKLQAEEARAEARAAEIQKKNEEIALAAGLNADGTTIEVQVEDVSDLDGEDRDDDGEFGDEEFSPNSRTSRGKGGKKGAKKSRKKKKETKEEIALKEKEKEEAAILEAQKAAAAAGVQKKKKKAVGIMSAEDAEALLQGHVKEEVWVDPDAVAFRKPGERWYPTKKEITMRQQREEKMTKHELAEEAHEWDELLDPLTDNYFYVHRATLEVSTQIPRAVQAERDLKAEAEEHERNFNAAIAKMDEVERMAHERTLINLRKKII